MRDYAELARPFTLLAPAVGTLATSATASLAGGHVWPALDVALGVGAALAATSASNAWNQAYDVEIDRTNKPGRPVPSGRLTREQALRFGHAAAALALALAGLAGPLFALAILLGLAATWIYSAPPLRTKRNLVGALVTIAFARGFLVAPAGWSLVEAPWAVGDPWALGFVAFFFLLGAAATKDFADLEGDAAAGCRTLPLAVGPVRAAQIVAPFLVVPFPLLLVFQAFGLLGAAFTPLVVLTVALTIGGATTAWLLLRDPLALAESDRTHASWKAMYLLVLGLHVGTTLAYAFS